MDLMTGTTVDMENNKTVVPRPSKKLCIRGQSEAANADGNGPGDWPSWGAHLVGVAVRALSLRRATDSRGPSS
jgi:hypothetical protein